MVKLATENETYSKLIHQSRPKGGLRGDHFGIIVVDIVSLCNAMEQILYTGEILILYGIYIYLYLFDPGIWIKVRLDDTPPKALIVPFSQI